MRSVRAGEVLGGDDTDSDGDEAPRAEEEAGCGRLLEGAVSLERQKKMCEGCGLKAPGYGLASEGNRRWCAGCGAVEGAVRLQKRKKCEGCGLKG
jgi:hypothetical protein